MSAFLWAGLLLKSAVLVALASMLGRSSRQASAATHHAVWTGLVIAVLSLPAIQAMAPRWDVPLTSVLPLQSLAGATQVALGVWAVGFLLAAGRLFLDLFRVSMVSHYGSRPASADTQALCDTLRRSMGIGRAVEVLESRFVRVPAAWGLRRPVVLLPEGAETWPRERLQLALLHELAHVRRGDYGVHLASELIWAAQWFNPLAWRARRTVRCVQERACDDFVTRSSVDPLRYAEVLLSIASSAGRAPRASLHMSGAEALSERIGALLRPERNDGPASLGQVAAAWTVLAGITVCLSGATWGARAEQDDVLATWELASSESPRALRALVDRTRAPDAAVRSAALLALGHGGHAQARVALEAGLNDEAARARESAVLGLSWLGGPAGLEAALRGLGDGDPGVRSVAVWALGRLGGAQARTALLEVAANDADAHNRQMAVGGLAELGGAGVLASLQERLRTGSPDARADAAFALGELGDSRAFTALARALTDDPEPGVRQTAATALRLLGDPRALTAWTTAMQDPHMRVRLAALRALAERPEPEARTALLMALQDPEHMVRINAALELGERR
ncbi:MAG: M56 family metallopeptidase [Gemmatimonadota bacterium]